MLGSVTSPWLLRTEVGEILASWMRPSVPTRTVSSAKGEVLRRCRYAQPVRARSRGRRRKAGGGRNGAASDHSTPVKHGGWGRARRANRDQAAGVHMSGPVWASGIPRSHDTSAAHPIIDRCEPVSKLGLNVDSPSNTRSGVDTAHPGTSSRRKCGAQSGCARWPGGFGDAGELRYCDVSPQGGQSARGSV